MNVEICRFKSFNRILSGKSFEMTERREKRIKIITLSENTDKTVTEIAKIVGMCKASVSLILKQYRETGNVDLKYQNCGGSNKKLTNRDLRRMRIISGNNPRMTAKDVQEEMGARGDCVSLRTIQRGLNDVGCRAERPKSKPFLTKAQAEKRYQWALEHRNWGEEQWNKVIWSDETVIELRDNCPQFVRVVDGFPLTSDHYCLTTKHPTRVIIWSCFSFYGPGRSHIVEDRMNTEWYVTKIIRNRVLQQLEQWYPGSDGVFQQDNAPCHKSKRAMEEFRVNNITVMDWPPSSPDINPIENLWGLVKKRIMKTKPKSKNEIITGFIKVWHNDDEILNIMQSLVKSMPRRVRALIDSRGFHTKY